MKTLLIVGLGSFLGGIARYLLAEFLHEKFKSAFPIGTFTVNILGCFLIGLLIGLVDKNMINENAKLFLSMGVLSGFTTYSAFSHQVLNLFRDGQMGVAFLYIITTIVLGLGATFLGLIIIKNI